jgi:hypothetical protein
MARTEVTVVEASHEGVRADNGTAGTADGHYFANSGEEILVVKNSGAGSHTVTVPTPRTVEGLDVDDQEIAIPAGQVFAVGPFEPNTFNNTGSNRGRVFVNYDATPGEVLTKVVRVRKAG